MRSVVVIYIIFLSLACKQTKPKINSDDPNPFEVTINDSIAPEENFKVIINGVVSKNDKFQLYYKDHNNAVFSAERMIEVVVIGKPERQTITFTLPSEIIPTHFRLDFGTNYSQDIVLLDDIILRNGRKEYEFDNEKFIQLFKGNKYTEFNVGSKQVQNQVIDGEYDPHYISINLEEIIFKLLD